MRNTYKKYNKSKKNLTRKLLGGAGRKQIRHKQHKSGENFEKLNLSLQVAKLFVETNKSLNEISTFLQERLQTTSYQKFRNKLAGTDTDGECRNAARVALSLDSTDCKCKGFIDSSARTRINNNYDNQIGEGVWEEARSLEEAPFNTANQPIGNISLDKKGENEYFYKFIGAGPCWLCNEPVYFYFDGRNKTSCGECEHVGSIMPSLFAGMLARQNLSAFIYNYGLSHVHCNQKKSNMVSMIFNHATLKWQYDTGSTKKIVNTILKGNFHDKEYCPHFKIAFNSWKGKERHRKHREMITKIKNHTVLWADKANEQLINTENSREKIKNATKLVQAIQFMVEKSIKNSDPSNSSSGGTRRRTSILREAPVGIYNYDGLNINIDTKEQIKEKDIEEILAYIRANKCVFETLVQILEQSVNDTKDILTEEDLEVKVNEDEFNNKVTTFIHEAAAAEAAAQAVISPIRSALVADPESYVTPAEERAARAPYFTQERVPFPSLEENLEISGIFAEAQAEERAARAQHSQRSFSVIPPKGAQSVLNIPKQNREYGTGARSVPTTGHEISSAERKRTSPYSTGQRSSQSPKALLGSSPHSPFPGGGKRKRRTRKKKRK